MNKPTSAAFTSAFKAVAIANRFTHDYVLLVSFELELKLSEKRFSVVFTLVSPQSAPRRLSPARFEIACSADAERRAHSAKPEGLFDYLPHAHHVDFMHVILGDCAWCTVGHTADQVVVRLQDALTQLRLVVCQVTK
jgi:hypothetical protein